jgi:molybdenum transport protein
VFFIPDRFLEELLEEDLPLDDLTSRALNLENTPGQVKAAAREEQVAANVEAAARLFALAGAQTEIAAPSGRLVQPGELILTAKGPAGGLHAVYKTAQNILEYSGGIASRCALLKSLAGRVNPRAEILVTRKHFPGTKRLSLSAALAGGASIHRTGLSDSILIFDQHREFTGGCQGLAELLPAAVHRYPEKLIAAEAATPQEAEFLARAGAGIIQCEKFSPQDLAAAVPRLRAINPQIRIVAAGGINSTTVSALAASGADGLVTSWPYYAKPLDVSMRFERLN